jgi:hypothetical protein
VISEAAKHTYEDRFFEDRFFDNLDIGGRRSAQHVGFLHRHLPQSSVLDIGRGRGVWVDESRQGRAPWTLWVSYAEVRTRPRYVFEKTIMSKGASSEIPAPLQIAPVDHPSQEHGAFVYGPS